MTWQHRRVWRQWLAGNARWVRPLLDGLLGLVSVLAVALGTLLLEGLIVGIDRVDWRVPPAVLTVSLLLLLAAWVAVLWLRRNVSGVAGSLYYIRMIDPSMQDWHAAAEARAAVQFLHLYEVTRPVLMAPNSSGVVDVRDQVESMHEKLQDLFNSDDQKTGFQVAPNMLWPLALGLGYSLALPRTSAFLELSDIDGGSLWKMEDVQPHRGAQVTWSDLPGAQAGVVTPRSTVVTAAMVRPADDRRGPSPDPVPWVTDRRINVGVLDEVGAFVGEGCTVGVRSGQVDPAAAVQTWVAAIRRALHDSAGPVLLTARVPKTVALAAGYRLGHPHLSGGEADDPGCGVPGCRRSACRLPWQNLVPLHFDVKKGRYLPVWVEGMQDDPSGLLALLADADGGAS